MSERKRIALLIDCDNDGSSDLINDIIQYPKPQWMPPRPILDIEMKSVIWARKINLKRDVSAGSESLIF